MGMSHREMAREKIENGISWSGENRVVEGAELAAFVDYWRGHVDVFKD